MTRSLLRRAASALAATALALGASGCGVFGGGDTKTFSADFDRAIRENLFRVPRY